MARGDQRPRDGGPAERVVTGEIERVDLGVNADPGIAEPPQRRHEPCASRRALGGQRGLERLVVRVHLEPEDVQLATRDLEPEAARDGVDLDPGDQLERLAEPRRAELAVARQVVVVGDGEQPDAGRGGLVDELERLEDAIRTGRVGVEIGRRGTGRRAGRA